MKGTKILTPAQERDIAHRYRAGESQGDLAGKFGCSATTIQDALRRQGIPAKKQSRRTTEQKLIDNLTYRLCAFTVGAFLAGLNYKVIQAYDTLRETKTATTTSHRPGSLHEVQKEKAAQNQVSLCDLRKTGQQREQRKAKAAAGSCP